MRMLRWLGIGVVLLLLALAAALTPAQLDIRTLTPELPEPSALLPLDDAVDGPLRLTWIETARQESPLPPPAVLSHPSFVLEWADGRLLLVDLGMTPDAAKAFGAPFERLGAPPTETFGSVADQLGPAVARVAGVVVTHLHTDHVEGGVALCGARGPAAIPLFQVPAQAERRNFTTRLADPYLVQASCLVPEVIDGPSVRPIPGFPGVGLIHAAGHTPGSQMLAAAVGPPGAKARWIFTGDVINDVAAAREDRPKALLYRLLIVPEADTQLGRARRLLATLEREHGFGLAVAHDGNHLRASGIPSFVSRAAP